MNLLVLSKNRILTTKRFVVTTTQILQSLFISDSDMSSITGYLKYNLDEWGYIHRAHPQFAKTTQDITELMPDVQLTDPCILVHFRANWLVICDEGAFLPVILQFNPNCRDGLSVAFYRLVQGTAARWLPQCYDHCLAITESMQVPSPLPLPPEIPSPYEEMMRFRL